MKEVDEFGRERVRSALREKLADLATVSVVRISDFYVKMLFLLFLSAFLLKSDSRSYVIVSSSYPYFYVR